MLNSEEMEQVRKIARGDNPGIAIYDKVLDEVAMVKGA